MTRLIARVLLTQRAFIASEEGNHFDGADEARPAARPNQVIRLDNYCHARLLYFL